MNSIKTKNKEFHENTSFTFDATGMWIELTLNIKPNMKKYLSANNVFKGEKHYVYRVKKHIDSVLITENNVKAVHEYLLGNAMMRCREAKQRVIQDEINTIKNKQINN